MKNPNCTIECYDVKCVYHADHNKSIQTGPVCDAFHTNDLQEEVNCPTYEGEENDLQESTN